MSAVLAHGAGVIEGGSPLYSISPDHLPALAAALATPLLALGVAVGASAGSGSARLVVAGYRALGACERLAAWMLLISAAAHLGLAGGHGSATMRVLFLVDGAALTWLTLRLVRGRSWRRPAAIVLTASIVGYAAVHVGGEPPDQVGLATKLVELTALAVALTPARRGLRRLAGSTLVVVLAVATGAAAWAGAFGAAEAAGEGRHAAAAAPGTIMGAAIEREPTDAERAAVARFRARAEHALARYRDPSAAARDGYEVGRIAGLDAHAAHPGHAGDGRVFDPARPESLVYADGPNGPVLLGAMYEMPELGRPGPAIGGPLTVWHAHENVCFGLTPPSLSGLTSPLGGCPLLSVTIPVTAEMIHLWLIPGAPTFGEIDDETKRAYVEAAGVRERA